MKNIQLTRGKEAIVDDEDYKYLSSYNWHCTDKGYARRHLRISNGKKLVISMHAFIMKTPKGMDTDHINGNKLDNRKENLRICTRSQNKINQNLLSKNTSGYIGVDYVSRLKKWRAQISIMNKKTYIGIFETKEEAGLAYNKVAFNNFGVFARLNSITI